MRSSKIVEWEYEIPQFSNSQFPYQPMLFCVVAKGQISAPDSADTAIRGAAFG
jgi:hypothetical protein